MNMDLFAMGLAESSESVRYRSRRQKGRIGWDNRTSGRSYSPPRKSVCICKPRKSVVKIDRYSVRPYVSFDEPKETNGCEETCLVHINKPVLVGEDLYRKVVGDSLYVRRGELVRELVTLYGADKRVCMLASVNMLLRWKSCYKRSDVKRLVSMHM